MDYIWITKYILLLSLFKKYSANILDLEPPNRHDNTRNLESVSGCYNLEFYGNTKRGSVQAKSFLFYKGETESYLTLQ